MLLHRKKRMPKPADGLFDFYDYPEPIHTDWISGKYPPGDEALRYLRQK